MTMDRALGGGDCQYRYVLQRPGGTSCTELCLCKSKPSIVIFLEFSGGPWRLLTTRNFWKWMDLVVLIKQLPWARR